MTNKERIQNFYLNDGIRNEGMLNTILHENVILEWDSSDGKILLEKNDILKLANEFERNYHSSIIEISHLIEDGSFLVVKYSHKVSSIENPREIIPIAKVVVIWEFVGDKLIKGYQISQPA